MTFKRKKYFLILVCSIATMLANAQIDGIKAVGDPCVNFTIALQVTGTSSSQFFYWNFDDPASGINNTDTITGASVNTNPVHTFTGIGVYNVCATYQEPGQPLATICQNISIGLCCNGIISANDSCRQNSIAFTLNTIASISAISWNFDDAASGSSNTSTSVAPSHLFSAPGNYNVTAVVTADCGNFTVTNAFRIVDCTPPPPCTGSIAAVDSCLANGTGFSVSSSSAISAISWNFGDAPSGSSNTSTSLAPTHFFSAAGDYTITAIVTAACGSFTVTKAFSVVDCTPPSPCTGSIVAIDSCLANGTGFSVSSSSAISGINWNFGDAASGLSNTSTSLAPTHFFSAVGDYMITANVTAACGAFVITQPLTIIICVAPPPCTATITNTGNCSNANFVFGINSASAINSVRWNFSDPASGLSNTSTSLAPTHLFSTPGSYTVTAVVNLVCGIDTAIKTISVINCDTATGNCTLQIANAFSPNRDGINDVFNPRTNCTYTKYELLIFDRWGQPVYEAKNASNKWNGRYKGKDCPIGMYVYLLKYQFAGQAIKTSSGSIILLR